MSIEHSPVKEGASAARAQFRPISVTVETACALTGLGRTSIYALAKAGKLRIVKAGSRTLIPYTDLERIGTGEAA